MHMQQSTIPWEILQIPVTGMRSTCKKSQMTMALLQGNSGGNEDT